VALQEAVAAQRREELLQELHRHRSTLGDLRDRNGPIAGARELGERDDGVPGLRGHGDHSCCCIGRSGVSENARSFRPAS
jgi:hypothetical protein